MWHFSQTKHIINICVAYIYVLNSLIFIHEKFTHTLWELLIVETPKNRCTSRNICKMVFLDCSIVKCLSYFNCKNHRLLLPYFCEIYFIQQERNLVFIPINRNVVCGWHENDEIDIFLQMPGVDDTEMITRIMTQRWSLG